MAKILVTDNSTFMRRFIVETLQKEGYKDVQEVSSGEETLKILKKEKIDLVLLDIMMPNMNGLEVLEKIGHKQKVVVVSAVGHNEVKKHAKALGAFGFITKPFSTKDILEKVEEALNS